MQRYHKILEHQIARFLGDKSDLLPQLQQFLEAVNVTYIHADEDRALIERSLDIRSKELTDINSKIREGVIARTRQLYQEHIRFVASLNSLRAGFAMFDKTGRLEMMNSAMRYILSPAYASGDILQANFDDVDLRRRWTLEDIDAQLGDAADIKDSFARVMETQKPVDYANKNYSGHIVNIFLAPVSTKVSGDTETLGAVMVLEDVI